jgi:hypothetical protein
MEKGRRDWRALCEAASKEKDSKRLLALVKELNEVLDETRNARSIYSKESRQRAQVRSTLQNLHVAIGSPTDNHEGAQRE